MSRRQRPRRATRSAALLAALGLLVAGHGASAAPSGQLAVAKHTMPDRLGGPPPGAPGVPPGRAFGFRNIFGANGIRYHGGPIMLGATNAYAIFYGGWSGSPTPALITQFLGDDGGSSYFNINTTYTDGAGHRVTNAVNFVESTPMGYTYGTTLSDANVQQIVADAIASGKLPPPNTAGTAAASLPDPNGVYFVLTSKDVGESSGFLTTYCGWHTSGTIAGVDTKYSFVGDASKNLSACAGQTAASPNNNPAGDAMVNVVAHELEESVTDPDLNAWYDWRGMENADKCAWMFGSTTTMPNGAKYNMTMNGHPYLIQQNWLNANGGLCALSY
jgi:hypothetical protein